MGNECVVSGGMRHSVPSHITIAPHKQQRPEELHNQACVCMHNAP